MDLSPLQLLLASVLIFLGALVQSAVGFGLAVVAAPLLFLVEPRLVPGPLLFLALVLSVLNVWRNRADLAFGELGGAIVGRIPGMLAALWLLQAATPRLLSLLLGLSVLAAIVVSLARVRIEPTPGRLFIAGLASGFMGTSTSIGGPPMALIYQHAPGARVRANLSGYFIVGCCMSLVGLALIGRYGWQELAYSLALVPPALLGFVAAGYTLARVDRGLIRPALLVLCAIAALGVLIEGLSG